MTSYLTSIIVPWTFALATAGLLWGRARENRNPLEWPLVDRCLIILALFCFAGGTDSLVTLLEARGASGASSHLNQPFMAQYFRFTRIMGVTIVSGMALGFVLRRTSPDSRLFACFVILSNAVLMAMVSWAKGSVTHPAPMLLALSFGVLCLILFRPALSLSWVAAFSLSMAGAVILTRLKVIPYAPFYRSSPFLEGQVDTWFLTGRALSVSAFFLLALAIVGYILYQWRDREAKLAEMTALLKKMFGRYLSVDVMNDLIEKPLAMEMGGERREVVIMMTDLRGFTALSRRLSPEKVVTLLNTYFEVMVDVILSYHGTINEIIGDALLVVFGAPQDMPDRVLRSIACAVEMQNRMAGVNEKNRAQGLPTLEMGIGLNEDEVIVGNIGSSKRIKYAVVGSGVNMAARIESYSVGGQVLISSGMRQRAGDLLRIDGHRQVLPKGADTPLSIYAVGGIAGPYNLSLEQPDPEPAALAREIPVSFSLVGGKHVGQEEYRGAIYRLSGKSAWADLEGDPDILANIKISLQDSLPGSVHKEIYAKVLAKGADPTRPHSCCIRFTAVPPEVASYFTAFIRHAPALGQKKEILTDD